MHCVDWKGFPKGFLQHEVTDTKKSTWLVRSCFFLFIIGGSRVQASFILFFPFSGRLTIKSDVLEFIDNTRNLVVRYVYDTKPV